MVDGLPGVVCDAAMASLNDPDYGVLKPAFQITGRTLRPHNLQFPAEEMSWVGASLFASVQVSIQLVPFKGFK